MQKKNVPNNTRIGIHLFQDVSTFLWQLVCRGNEFLNFVCFFNQVILLMTVKIVSRAVEQTARDYILQCGVSLVAPKGLH